MALVANIGCAKVQGVSRFPTSEATYSIQRMECSACDGNMNEWAKDEIAAVLTERNAYDPKGGTPLTVTVFPLLRAVNARTRSPRSSPTSTRSVQCMKRASPLNYARWTGATRS